jgi:GT2 family glycosyltransferase
MSRLTIQIVGWNSAGVLPETLKALQNLPRSEVIVRYIDNASADDSCALVRKMVPWADVIKLSANRGFAGGHNVGFSHCTTPFVLTLDPDVVLDWKGINEVLASFTDKAIGAAQGILYRSSGTQGMGRHTIDSAGIVHSLALNGKDRGAAELDHGQYTDRADLLAVTGACGCYRMKALRSVAYPASLQKHTRNTLLEIFDNDFFSYKEDVDLGWRLSRAGWKILYVPVRVGMHRRTLGKRGALGWGLNPITIYQRLKSPRTRYSLRNYVWMLLKNVTLKQELKHELFIDARLLVFFMLSFLYLPLWATWWEIGRGFSSMVKKRTAQQMHRARPAS